MPALTVPDSLRIDRRHAPLSRQRDNAIAQLAEQLTLQRGSLKGRQEPGGFTPHVGVSTTSDPDHDFKAVLTQDAQGKPELTFLTAGHVGGVVPVLVTADGEELAMDDSADGESDTRPALPIPDSAFAPRGRVEKALILFRYDLRPEDATVSKVTVIAAAEVPGTRAWTWHRLAGWVRRFQGTDTWVPMIFFSQQFDVSDVNQADGRFKAWPRIA